MRQEYCDGCDVEGVELFNYEGSELCADCSDSEAEDNPAFDIED